LSRGLTPDERSILSRLVDEVAPLAEATPDKFAALGEVARLLLAFPASSLGPDAATARSEAYAIALEDVPAWTVKAAARRWIRGEVSVLGDKPNLSFPPSPPQLRTLALEEWAKARAALWRYRRLMEGREARVVPLEQRRPLPREMLQAHRSAFHLTKRAEGVVAKAPSPAQASVIPETAD